MTYFHRRRRAFTLVETVVGLFVLGVFLTGAYSLLSMFLYTSRLSAAQIDLENNAQKALARMTSEIADSKASTVVVGTSPPGVVFLSPRDGKDTMQRDSSGNLYWNKWTCYYLDTSTSQLIRSQIPITATTTVPSNNYTTASFQSAGTKQTMATSMTALTCTGTSPVIIGATFTTSVFAANDVKIQVQDAITPRN